MKFDKGLLRMLAIAAVISVIAGIGLRIAYNQYKHAIIKEVKDYKKIFDTPDPRIHRDTCEVRVIDKHCIAIVTRTGKMFKIDLRNKIDIDDYANGVITYEQ
jgi:hypothetical protein